MESQEPKIVPELVALQNRFANLIERGARECALGALQTGLRELATLVAAHPECALVVDARLAEEDASLAASVATGDGIRVTMILNRIATQVRPGPQSNGFNLRHHPMTAPAPRPDVPPHTVEIDATGAITFAPVPAPNEKHDDE